MLRHGHQLKLLVPSWWGCPSSGWLLPYSPSSSLSQSGLCGLPAATYRALSSSSRPVLRQAGMGCRGSGGGSAAK